MNKEQIRKAFEKFTEKNDFILNKDKEFVDKIIDGILKNENSYGLKLCPCRLRNGTRERDLELICPCNFKIQVTWLKQGRCWCGLFFKRE